MCQHAVRFTPLAGTDCRQPAMEHMTLRIHIINVTGVIYA